MCYRVQELFPSPLPGRSIETSAQGQVPYEPKLRNYAKKRWFVNGCLKNPREVIDVRGPSSGGFMTTFVDILRRSSLSELADPLSLPMSHRAS